VSKEFRQGPKATSAGPDASGSQRPTVAPASLVPAAEALDDPGLDDSVSLDSLPVELLSLKRAAGHSIATDAAAMAEAEGAADVPTTLVPAARPSRIADLIQEIKDSADKLASDAPSRGDLKLLSRAIRELRYAFKVFTPYRSQRKVTVFGSARTPPTEPPYLQAEAFGRAIAAYGWLVVTGAASGIMEAGHRGAGRENSMGLNIMLPFEQDANPIIAGDPKLVHMRYFFTRKLMFVKECDAVCLFPGGFGTLDEGIEVLTLLQTGKRDIVPVVFLDAPGGVFWKAFQQYVIDYLLADRMISPEDLSLYKVTDSLDEAVQEIVGFYRVYHSMRYVRNKLVLRLKTPPSDELLAAIGAEFDDILSEGEFKVTGPLPEERDEAAMVNMTRLVFRFNRRNLGRLRQLIDSLNAGRIVVPELPQPPPRDS